MKQSGPKPSRFQAREQMVFSWHAASRKYLRVSAQPKSAGGYRSVLIQPHATLPKTREAGRKSTRRMSPAPASTIAQHHVCDSVAPPLEQLILHSNLFAFAWTRIAYIKSAINSSIFGLYTNNFPIIPCGASPIASHGSRHRNGCRRCP